MADNVAITAGTGTNIGTKDLAGVHLQKYIWVNEAGAFIAKAEDSAHSSGDYLLPAGAVRNDAGTALAGTTLDYIPFTTNSVGDLWVAIHNTPNVAVASGDIDVTSHIAEDLLIGSYASQTSTPTDVENVNLYWRGVIVTVKVTNLHSVTPILTPSLSFKDSLGANSWISVWTATTPISTVSTNTYYFYPTSCDATFTEKKIMGLPRNWKVTITHTDADACTYTVGASYLL